MIDRLSIRTRPSGTPVMLQSWMKLSFMHWPIEVQTVRSHVPSRLTVDTFENQAWIGITPFVLRHLRAPFLPEFPYINQFHELNVRTYVHFEGTPGIFFFSLNATKQLPIAAARFLYGLPYVKAKIRSVQEGDVISYKLNRGSTLFPPAEFQAQWRIGEPLAEAEPDSLEFFLTERYCFYVAQDNRLYRTRVSHPPWSLKSASLLSFQSNLLASHGLPEPGAAPLIHYSERLDVEVWGQEELAGVSF